MSFQYVIDNAETISISSRKRVAQTVSRSGVTKATSAGGQVYEFRVQLPNGPRWTDNRRLIQAVEALDRTTVGTIQFNNAAHEYIYGYQGDISPYTSIQASYTSGNTITLVSGATIGSGYKFRAGDYIQLGTNNSVYTVVADVPYTSNTVTLNRPVRESAGTYALRVGEYVTWDVICVEMPTWTLFGYDQISWSGAFVFVEAV